MPGVSGVTVVTNARVFYHHARLRAHQAPGIPCALWFRGTMTFQAKLADECGEIAKSWLFEI
jgi:hypothetical protein